MKKNILLYSTLLLLSVIVRGYIPSHASFIQDKSDKNVTVTALSTDLRGAQLPNLNGASGDFIMVNAQPCEQTDTSMGVCTVIDGTLAGFTSSNNSQSSDFSGGNFSGANLSNSSFAYAKFNNANFVNAQALNTDFTGADFTGADFTGFVVADVNLAVAVINTPTDDDDGSDSTPVTASDLDKSDISDYQITCFCNSIMPDGTVCSGDSWTNSSGDIFKCNCEADDVDSDS